MTQQKFAVFDIDGTLFRSGLYRELALELMRRGVIDEELIKQVKQKLAEWKKRSCRDAYDHYEAALVRALDGSLPFIPTAIYDAAAEKIAAAQLDHVYTYTRHRLAELKDAGYFLIAISGSQEELVRPFALKYGFDSWVGQKYVRDGERFTGEIIKTYTGKDTLLRKIVAKFNLSWQGSYAFGDSGGDRHMLDIVENPVAFNPTEDLLELAIESGWPVVIERKSVVFELVKGDHGYVLANAGKI